MLSARCGVDCSVEEQEAEMKVNCQMDESSIQKLTLKAMTMTLTLTSSVVLKLSPADEIENWVGPRLFHIFLPWCVCGVIYLCTVLSVCFPWITSRYVKEYL